MKYELAMRHAQMSRRHALKLGAAGAAGAATLAALPGIAAADNDDGPVRGRSEGRGRPGGGGGSDDYSDDLFTFDEVRNWAPSQYGEGDERGTLNELTPENTAESLKILKRGQPANTYQMGEEMFNYFPAFPSTPPRNYDMRLYALGFPVDGFSEDPDDWFPDDPGNPPDGYEPVGIQAGTVPFAPDANRLIGFEERFDRFFTFQIASQVDGLNHIGIAFPEDEGGGTAFYNGFTFEEMATPTGTTHLGNETMGPIVTRGIILDIVGLKVASGGDDVMDYNGNPVLEPNYRITIDDIENAMYRQRIRKPIGPGDVPIFRTGWTHLTDNPAMYLPAEPGIYLAEARYLADRRVALVAADTWGLETLDADLTAGAAFPVHQVLITQHGIRIGESFVCESAVADHAYEGVLVVTPENHPGATCGSTPPAFIAQPGRSPRR
jgi:kynurenine formamidase